jgi:hypothetical protein
VNECKACGRPILAPQQVYCGDACFELANGDNACCIYHNSGGSRANSCGGDQFKSYSNTRGPDGKPIELKRRITEAQMLMDAYKRGRHDGAREEREKTADALLRKGRGTEYIWEGSIRRIG